MATVLQEGLRTAEFLVSAEENLSLDQVVIPANTAAVAVGTVMGKITASGKWIPYAEGASDGSQTAAGILYRSTVLKTVNQPAVVLTGLAEVQAALLTGLTAAARASLDAKFIKFR